MTVVESHLVFPEIEINKFPFANYRRGGQMSSADDEESDGEMS